MNKEYADVIQKMKYSYEHVLIKTHTQYAVTQGVTTVKGDQNLLNEAIHYL